jgi:hypothetical protein
LATVFLTATFFATVFTAFLATVFGAPFLATFFAAGLATAFLAAAFLAAVLVAFFMIIFCLMVMGVHVNARGAGTRYLLRAGCIPPFFEITMIALFLFIVSKYFEVCFVANVGSGRFSRSAGLLIPLSGKIGRYLLNTLGLAPGVLYL